MGRRYHEDQDRGLDMHTDASDITLNVALGREFTGATLQFCGRMGDADHRKASCPPPGSSAGGEGGFDEQNRRKKYD